MPTAELERTPPMDTSEPEIETFPPDAKPMDPDAEARYQRRKETNPPVFLRTTGLESGNARDQLEPIGLDVLAGFLWEKTLVDLRVVETGTVERVQILEILVAREKDTVTVRQCWARDDDHGVRVDELTFDAENVRWARPTQVDLFDVEPIEAIESSRDDQDAAQKPWRDSGAIFRAIVDCYVFIGPFSEVELTQPKGVGDRALRHRQEMMVLLYEMTDLTPPEICVTYFGYRSGMPLSTAYGRACDRGWPTRVRKRAKVIDAKLKAYGKQRRSKDAPRSWKGVLL